MKTVFQNKKGKQVIAWSDPKDTTKTLFIEDKLENGEFDETKVKSSGKHPKDWPGTYRTLASIQKEEAAAKRKAEEEAKAKEVQSEEQSSSEEV